MDNTTQYRRLFLRNQEIKLQANENEDADTAVIEGYFAMYGNEFPYFNWSLQLEEGALAESIASNPDVVFLFNHLMDDIPMARTPNTLELEDRPEGVWGRAEVSLKNPQSAALVDAIKRGDVRATSIGLQVEDYEFKRGGELEVITKASLDYQDVSAVTHPANPLTNNEISVLMSQPLRPRSVTLAETAEEEAVEVGKPISAAEIDADLEYMKGAI